MPDTRQELIAKLERHVDAAYDGDYRKAFDHYDRDGDGRVAIDELHDLLTDAGVGTRWTWKIWARGIMDALDSDKDGKISWPEFDLVLNAKGG